MKKQISMLLLLLTLLGCSFFNNPVDPEAGAYQGYYTLDDINNISIDEIYGNSSIKCSDIYEVTKYHLQISVYGDFSTIAYEQNNYKTNLIEFDEYILPTASYYIRVRAFRGEWGNWSEPWSLNIYTYSNDVENLLSIRGNGYVTLSWNDIDTRFDSFSHFRIFYELESEVIEFTGEIDSDGTTITGLENYLEYKFTVQIVNINGDASDGIIITETPTDFKDLKLVPAGVFDQKDSFNNKFTHSILGFYIGKYEVTYDLWYEVYSWAIKNGYAFANPGSEGSYGTIEAEPTEQSYNPVTSINWRDCIVWCNAYSEKSGLDVVYRNTNGQVIKDSNNSNSDAAVIDWYVDGYRLPTEGEWLYARSKNISEYDSFSSMAWYRDNSEGNTHLVGYKAGGYLDIYDMIGNVWEWCYDWQGNYPVSYQTDFRGSISGNKKIRLGGSFISDEDYLKKGYRLQSRSPVDKGPGYGFRIVTSYGD